MLREIGHDDPVVSDDATGRTRSTLAIIRFAVLVVVLLVVGAILAISGTDGLRGFLTDLGESKWGVVGFVVAYAIAVLILIPGTIGTLTAGAVFGFPLGGFAALCGASIGATLAFMISRALGREGAQSLFGSRLTEVDDFIGRNDFSSILVLRLMPVVPFNVFNYAAGITSVRLSRYVAASVVGMAPGAFLTTALADQADDPTGAPFLILFGLFLAALAGSAIVGTRMRRVHDDV